MDSTPITWTRPTQPEDIARCETILNQSYETDMHINYMVFPPEDTSGIVLEHRDDGIIGCVVWNNKTNHISSIAVHPNHRRHSMTLVDGLMEYAAIHSPNTPFKAELLETTAYPLVKLMAARDRLELIEADISHHLDGVPCISVEMKPSKRMIEKFQNDNDAASNPIAKAAALYNSDWKPSAVTQAKTANDSASPEEKAERFSELFSKPAPDDVGKIKR